MAELTLKTVVRSQGNNEALKDGTVKPLMFNFDFVEVEPLISAFRRMVRGLEFDICEMAMTTYITARACGKRMTGLPIFVMRAFHHSAIVVNTDAGITHPKELEGKRVGVDRGYTVTTGLWARRVLTREYGVDLRKITWVLSGDEHVAEYRPPSNVVAMQPGRTMAEMLASGELVGAIGPQLDYPNVTRLIPNAAEAGFDALRSRGHYPINHLMVVKDDLLERYPDLGPDIFSAFAEAKRLYVEQLKNGSTKSPSAVDQLYKRVMEITGRDPLPYGIEPNRTMLEEIVESAVEQQIISTPVRVDDLFATNTRRLVG